ncbi:MAG TPA: pyrroline-5-carboxylate reductase [Pirellulales bacterium]|nr:pyrroline-5-carboxylate reductase [Pirellulales bacterium]
MFSQSLGFIGAGQMARALAKGFASANLVEPDRISAYDPLPAALQDFCGLVNGAISGGSNAEVVERSSVVVLAVKPQMIPAVAAELHGRLAEKLLISIAAGVRLKSLAELFGTTRVIRVMPNMPALVGSSASGYSLASGATADDARLVERLFSAVGRVVVVDEKLLDAVTGLSGSGPAFVFVMIEALADGGVRMGLPRAVALTLAAQTCKGAAEMVLATGDHPATLKDRVASPGGTTIAGLQALETGAVRAALMAAVEAATRRATELGGD